ncbi:unnamed protein product [Diatraea saccharalis]|uniref:HORMA domain-containing protein n=1 Tax=Diatraea saccharalis TaxID=40085 RepID=A0A9N9RGI0_9NEOP|nr:unnamed protein product [Diatraea saccharalis]
MDCSFVDITTEFLAVAFHTILYYSHIYPNSIFETRRKYNVVVYNCIHPEVSQYISLCLKSVRECLKSGQLRRVVFAITNDAYEPVIKFVFDVFKSDHFDETNDAYLIQTEQNLRAFCLHLSSNVDKLKCLPDDCSFTVYIHTNETMAVSLSVAPDSEEFPLVEICEINKENEAIIPLRSFSIRNHSIESYIEL